jgi:DNA mismatch repair protein MutL
LANIREGLTVDPAQLREKLFSLIACKAAVKAGDVMTPAEMHSLVARLHALEHKTTCPHGRPTMWVISQRELEKRFQRIG